MKKLGFIIIVVLLGCFAACNKDTEYHQTRFLRPSDTPLLVYADQEWDSIAFQTTESFELSTNVAWCKVDERYKSLDIPYSNALVDCYAWLQFEPNTTGESRYAIVHLGAGDYSIDGFIVQYPFLCITSPTRYGEGLTPLTFNYNETQKDITFTAFGEWTIAQKEPAAWVTQLSRIQGGEGDATVTVTLETNTTGADRSAIVTLTSRGVSEDITITQYKQPEEE